MAARRHLGFDPTGNGAVRSAVHENPGQCCNQIQQHTQLTDRRYQLTTTVDRTSLAVVIHRSGEMVHMEHLQHYHSTTRNTLDCDQSNVYSSRVVSSAISQDLLFRSFSLYRRLATLTLPYKISFESPSL